MTISAENSCRIANLSFLIACIVVLVHVPWPHEGPVGMFFVLALRNPLAAIVVPFFATVVGYFLSAHFSEPSWWKTALRRRIRTILIPYVFWMAFGAVLMWMLSGMRPIGLNNSGLNLARQPLFVPLWFLRAILIFVALSPVVRWAVRRGGAGVVVAGYLAAASVAALLVSGFGDPLSGWGCFLVNGLSLEFLCYFSLGIWIGGRPLPKIGHQAVWACLSVGLSLIALRLVFWLCGRHLPFDPYILAAPFLLVAIWHFVPTRPLPNLLTGSAFAIYVMHAVVLSVIWVVPSWKAACPFALTVLLGIALPILTCSLLSRFAPPVAKLLFGGRIGSGKGKGGS